MKMSNRILSVSKLICDKTCITFTQENNSRIYIIPSLMWAEMWTVRMGGKYCKSVNEIVRSKIVKWQVKLRKTVEVIEQMPEIRRLLHTVLD
jgi:transposase-like protein